MTTGVAVLLVDDSDEFLTAVERFIADQPGLSVIGRARSGPSRSGRSRRAPERRA